MNGNIRSLLKTVLRKRTKRAKAVEYILIRWGNRSFELGNYLPITQEKSNQSIFCGIHFFSFESQLGLFLIVFSMGIKDIAFKNVMKLP